MMYLIKSIKNIKIRILGKLLKIVGGVIILIFLKKLENLLKMNAENRLTNMVLSHLKIISNQWLSGRES